METNLISTLRMNFKGQTPTQNSVSKEILAANSTYQDVRSTNLSYTKCNKVSDECGFKLSRLIVDHYQ